MDGERLAMKMLIQIVEDDVVLSEEFIIQLIQVVEKRIFHFVTYLNLPES